jgi:hypothetical protein
MSAKNAVVNLIILSTFLSFLLYRRGNKGKLFPFSQQGWVAKLTVGGVGLFCIFAPGLGLWGYAQYLFHLDPSTMDLAAERARYFQLPAWLLIIQAGTLLAAIGATFIDRGKLAQALCFIVTTVSVVFILGVYGYVIMGRANPFLRNIAVVQVLLVLSCLIMNTVIDIFLFRGAEEVGGIRWGKMPVRSQYTLLLLCISIVLLMGLMGFIRSGLREDWHIYGVLRDTSEWAFTPTMAYMGKVVGIVVTLFLSMVAFVFWLSGLAEKGGSEKGAFIPELAEKPTAQGLNPGSHPRKGG